MELVLKSGLFGSPTINKDRIQSIVNSESKDSIGNVFTRLVDATLDHVCLTERVQAKQYLFDVFSANSTCQYKHMAFHQLEYLTSSEFNIEFRIDEKYGQVTYSILINNDVLISSNINTDEYVLEYPELGDYYK